MYGNERELTKTEQSLFGQLSLAVFLSVLPRHHPCLFIKGFRKMADGTKMQLFTNLLDGIFLRDKEQFGIFNPRFFI